MFWTLFFIINVAHVVTEHLDVHSTVQPGGIEKNKINVNPDTGKPEAGRMYLIKLGWTALIIIAQLFLYFADAGYIALLPAVASTGVHLMLAVRNYGINARHREREAQKRADLQSERTENG